MNTNHGEIDRFMAPLDDAVAKMQAAANIANGDLKIQIIKLTKDLQHFSLWQDWKMVCFFDELRIAISLAKEQNDFHLIGALETAFNTAIQLCETETKVYKEFQMRVKSPLVDLVQTMGRIADTLDEGGIFPDSISGKVPDLVKSIREKISVLPNSLFAGIETIKNVKLLLATEKRFDVSFFISDFDAIELELLAAIIEQKYQGRRL